MIDKIKYIYRNSHGNDYKIDLNKIIRQKDYVRFMFNPNDEYITKDDLDKLEENKMIVCIDERNYIISPLGYALLFDENSHFEGAYCFDDNVKYSLLQQVYDAMYKQIIDKFKTTSLGPLQCALGFFILINGGTSRENSIPFIKIEDTYQFFNVIENNLNELSLRLFYNSNFDIQYLKDHIHLRNVLGRNNKNGNLRKRTSFHSVDSDRGNGITYHWFEIENEDGSIDDEKLNYVLDKLLSSNKNLITLLNVKKIALNNSLINLLPYELKRLIGEQTTRAEVLQKIINYTTSCIEEYICNIKESNQLSMLEYFQSINIKPSSDYSKLLELNDKITEMLNDYPQLGIYLIEIHYRISKITSKETKDIDLFEIKDKKVYEIEEDLGSDFYDILNENINTCIKFFSSQMK